VETRRDRAVETRRDRAVETRRDRAVETRRDRAVADLQGLTAEVRRDRAVETRQDRVAVGVADRRDRMTAAQAATHNDFRRCRTVTGSPPVSTCYQQPVEPPVARSPRRRRFVAPQTLGDAATRTEAKRHSGTDLSLRAAHSSLGRVCLTVVTPNSRTPVFSTMRATRTQRRWNRGR
jgi:hypothetical protein